MSSVTIVSFALQDGWTPYDWAAESPHAEVVRKLLESGTNQDVRDEVRSVLFHELLKIIIIVTVSVIVLY